MSIPKLWEEKENGEHKYLCANCELEIFVLNEFTNCPRCGVRFKWTKVKGYSKINDCFINGN